MGGRAERLADRRGEAALPAHRGRGGGVLSRRHGPASLPGIVDAHAHLQHPQFDADREAVVARAVAAGIERLLVPGWDERSSEAALELASRHPGLLEAAVGIHPHHAAEPDEAMWARLEALASDPRCVAVGEIGLDLYRNFAPPDRQAATFERQLDLATRLDRSVVVHDRDAHAPVEAALMAWAGRAGASARGVMHAFSGDAEMALRLADAGFLISFALPLLFRSAAGPRAAALALPAAVILVETDAPYLGPDATRRNEPTGVLRVAAELARLRAVSLDAVVDSARSAFEGLVHHPAVVDRRERPPLSSDDL
jgi:TatD DNase family protein